MRLVLGASTVSFNNVLHDGLGECFGTHLWERAPVEPSRIAWKRMEWTVIYRSEWIVHDRVKFEGYSADGPSALLVG
jgi:hypothetical protein